MTGITGYSKNPNNLKTATAKLVLSLCHRLCSAFFCKLSYGLWSRSEAKILKLLRLHESYQSFKEVKNVSAIQRPGRPCCFPIGPKNTNLVEDFEILLPVKFRWIPFSSIRGEVENVSANQRPGRPSCFSDQPEKHKLGTGRWDLASCQVSLNSFQRFQRRSWKSLSQSETRAAILFFQSALKTQTW